MSGVTAPPPYSVDFLDDLKRRVSRLSPSDYQHLIYLMLESEYAGTLDPFPDQTVPAFIKDLGSASVLSTSSFSVYLIDETPVDALQRPDLVDIDTQELRRRIDALAAHLRGRRPESVLFMNNLSGFTEHYHTELILPQYMRLSNARGLSPYAFAIGNPDSFVVNHAHRLALTLDELTELAQASTSGLALTIDEKGLSANAFTIESHLAGVHPSFPCDLLSTAITQTLSPEVEAISELVRLLDSGASENALESFLKRHYKEVFGPCYTEIRTQVWLRAMALDPDRKDRRTDVFLRNSHTADWELIELKRADVPLVKRSGSITEFTGNLHSAVAQAARYHHLLQQAATMEQLRRVGIEYFVPVVSVLIGRTPKMVDGDWRKFLDQNRLAAGIRTLTYDDLLTAMRQRLRDNQLRLESLGDRLRRGASNFGP